MLGRDGTAAALNIVVGGHRTYQHPMVFNGAMQDVPFPAERLALRRWYFGKVPGWPATKRQVRHATTATTPASRCRSMNLHLSDESIAKFRLLHFRLGARARRINFSSSASRSASCPAASSAAGPICDRG